MLFDVFRLAKAGTANARLAPWRVMHAPWRVMHAPWRVMHAMLARRLLA
jgi:hypothetical protein